MRLPFLFPALASGWLACGAIVARADEQPVFTLTLKNHRFQPDHLDVPAGQRFRIQLTNQDDTVDEFESYDMKWEKIVAVGATVTVRAGPLHPGTYKFFDDYHPDTATGTVTAKEGS
jgi:plastocyanin